MMVLFELIKKRIIFIQVFMNLFTPSTEFYINIFKNISGLQVRFQNRQVRKKNTSEVSKVDKFGQLVKHPDSRTIYYNATVNILQYYWY